MKGAKNIKNIKGKKFYLSVIVAAAVFVIILKLLTMTAATSTIPTLFINDLPSIYCEKYPLEMKDGFMCVPLVYIDELPETLFFSEGDASYILYQKYHYISFGNKDGLAVDMESEQRGFEFYCPVYTINNTKYVRAETVCNSLRITYEYEKYNGVWIWRIKDRTARKSLDELISKYIEEPTTPPQIETTTEAPTQPTTQPPIIQIPQETTEPNEQETTAEPTTEENTREIENYFMFRGIGRDYEEQNGAMQVEPETEEQPESEIQTETGQPVENENEFDSIASNEAEAETDSENISEARIYEAAVGEDNINIENFLDILKRENVKAIFFFTGSEILRNPTNLRQAYAMGHEVGIEIEGGKVNPSPEDLVSELEKVNALIYTLTKNKTRFYMLDDNMYRNDGEDNVSGISEELKLSCIETLTALGYCRIRETLAMPDSEEAQYIYELYADGGIEQAVNEMTEFLKQEELNVIRFDISDSDTNNAENTNEGFLDLVIKAANSKFYISVKKATVPFFASVNSGSHSNHSQPNGE